MIRIRTFKESPANQLYRNHIADVHKELGEFIFKEFPDLISISEKEEYTDYFIDIPNRIYLPYMGNFESPFYVVWFQNSAIPHIYKKEEVESSFSRANDSILYEGNLIDCENYFSSFMRHNKFLNKADPTMEFVTGLKINGSGY